MDNTFAKTFFAICFLSIFLVASTVYAEPVEMGQTVKKGYQIIETKYLYMAFEEYLCNRLDKDKSDIRLSRFKVTGNKAVPTGPLNIQVFQKEQRGLEGYVRLTGIIDVDGMVVNQVKLSGWVDVFEPVLCARLPLKKGHIVKEEDLGFVRKNITHLSSKVLKDAKMAVGMMVKHSVKEDTPIQEWMLQKAPVLEKGDMITILAESQGLRITVPGRALEKGYLGEPARVENAMSKKKLYAKVINESTVIVDF